VPDTMTPEARSQVMRAVRSRDTRPELLLRRHLWAAGLRGYRVHVKWLPGTPDLAYGRWKVAVFVDGTFWHGDPRRWHPERASDYWREKIARNQLRDASTNAALVDSGWVVVRIWDTDLLRRPAAAVEEVRVALSSVGWTPSLAQAVTAVGR